MNKTTIKNNRLTLFSFCIIFLFSSCVNELDSETSPDAVPGTIPINFTTKVSKADTRVTNTAFEKGDKVGLYAMLPSTPITESATLTIYNWNVGKRMHSSLKRQFSIRQEMPHSILSVITPISQPE